MEAIVGGRFGFWGEMDVAVVDSDEDVLIPPTGFNLQLTS
jgi:hypothetical protein